MFSSLPRRMYEYIWKGGEFQHFFAEIHTQARIKFRFVGPDTVLSKGEVMTSRMATWWP